MKLSLLITLFGFGILSDQAFGEVENGVKKGLYPFMAFLYYQDESIVEHTGKRFLRGAVLVKPDWLITTSVGAEMVNDIPHGFPRKTLLARVGAVTIDSKITPNEDEDEQEREIIQIVRPHNQSATLWWRTDITLLKTLLPFNLSTTVSVGALSSLPLTKESSCFILVFARKSENLSEDRALMQLYVDIQLDTTIENCGQHFYEPSMICAKDMQDNKQIYDSKFCVDNSGSPLVCDNSIIGLQTYVENKCSSPHIYQNLTAWKTFITCGIESRCNEEPCSKMCRVTNKDSGEYDSTTDVLSLLSRTVVELTTFTENITLFSVTPESPADDNEIAPSVTHTSTATEISSEETKPATTSILADTVSTLNTNEATSIETSHTETETSWPKEKDAEVTEKLEDDTKVEREPNVEAQRQDLKVVRKARNAAQASMCRYENVFSVIIVLSYLF